MKNRIIPRLSLIIVLISVVSLQNAYAQSMEWEEIPDGTKVLNLSGFETGKYILTESIKASIRELVEGPAGFKAQCADGKVVAVKGYSDPQKYEDVTEVISDLLNDQLASQRTQRAIRYATDELGMNEHCFSSTEPKYADSKIRGVGFAVVERSGGSWLYQRLNSHVDSTNNILDEIQQDITDIESEISEIKKKNAEQDSILNVHDGRITDNADDIDQNTSRIDSLENRLRHSEEQKTNRNWENVSAHIGLNGESFADQIAPTISAGIKVGQLEFAGWYGFMPNTGTADLDIGTVDLRRETYGGMATWYAINTGSLSLGPSIGWEHGEDAISGRGSYTRVIESVLAGVSLDVELIGPLHLRGNIAYAPVIKSYTYDNQVLQDINQPIRASLGISINF